MAEEIAVLIHGCLAGRQPAMSQLVRRFHPAVYRRCVGLLGHHQDAEDVTQETFLRVFGSLHRWNPSLAFEPWLLTIAGNRCRTHLARKSRRGPTVAIDEEPTTPGGCSATELADFGDVLQDALAELRYEYREAFRLFHLEQLSVEEVRMRLGRPLGTVKTWLRRARLQLAGRLRCRGMI